MACAAGIQLRPVRSDFSLGRGQPCIQQMLISQAQPGQPAPRTAGKVSPELRPGSLINATRFLGENQTESGMGGTPRPQPSPCARFPASWRPAQAARRNPARAPEGRSPVPAARRIIRGLARRRTSGEFKQFATDFRDDGGVKEGNSDSLPELQRGLVKHGPPRRPNCRPRAREGVTAHLAAGMIPATLHHAVSRLTRARQPRLAGRVSTCHRVLRPGLGRQPSRMSPAARGAGSTPPPSPSPPPTLAHAESALRSLGPPQTHGRWGQGLLKDHFPPGAAYDNGIAGSSSHFGAFLWAK